MNLNTFLSLTGVLLGLCLSGCMNPNFDIETGTVLPPATPWGEQIGTVEKWPDWKLTQTSLTTAPSVLENGRTDHFKRDVLRSPWGVVYVLIYTYLDEEDGGNAYGWVEDEHGKRIGKINDCDLEESK